MKCSKMDAEKTCPRCGAKFVCSHSADCWCASVTLNDAMRKILKQYEDCICLNCLKQLKKE